MHDDVLRQAKHTYQERCRHDVSEGKGITQSLHFIRGDLIKPARIHFPDVEFGERVTARGQQRTIDLARLETHSAVVGLLLGRRTQRVALSRARREVRRWQRRQLCSVDYIREWSQLLAGPVPALVDLLRADTPTATRLRQNSPFWLVLRRH
ncbi:hypothetical protein PWG14_17890 (plasmid) [Chromobacterium amazonense]|uniref:hypothetical protein n=1 Tax=Chromobacterium amazonense TaxID=1382803 RepID=UPI00237DCA0D|nr:hypothetical protein [Chromobacterium amazonense]MDE1714387.1 hypothetical protein [Chromobacterium amazonense]